MTVKCEILRSIVFTMYKREKKESIAGWDDIEASVINQSAILHKSVIEKRNRGIYSLERQARDQIIDEEEDFEEL